MQQRWVRVGQAGLLGWVLDVRGGRDDTVGPKAAIPLPRWGTWRPVWGWT